MKKFFEKKPNEKRFLWLAQERTILANERNSLAAVRTGFAAFALGAAFIKLLEQDIFFVYAGWVSVLIGTLFIALGLVYYPIRKRIIKLVGGVFPSKSAKRKG